MAIRSFWVALIMAGATAASTQVISFPEIRAPKLSGTKYWNSAKPMEFGGGKVTILHFWTFGCFNCEHNQPIYKRWTEKYRGSDVQIVGVHTPELSAERIEANVERYVTTHGVKYPVLMDGGSANWNRWGVRYWPTVYLVDKKGILRYGWEGELRYRGGQGDVEVERRIEELRREKG